jgi:hypothetical protein
MKGASLVILAVVALALIGWAATANDLAMQSYFSPRFEQVRRNTFEQSKSYNQGVVQELQNMQFQYVQADKEHKGALASIIKHRAADYPHDKMPSDLRNFIESL